MNKNKPTIITNPPKFHWAGDERVEPYMRPVLEAIDRHLDLFGPEFIDIYNRCYEAVYAAIKEYDQAA